MSYNSSGFETTPDLIDQEYSAVYNQILFGKKLTLQFPSPKHANAFRSALLILHKRTQAKYRSLGMDLGVQGRISLTRIWDTSEGATNSGRLYELKFTDAPKSATKFLVISVDEAQETEQN